MGSGRRSVTTLLPFLFLFLIPSAGFAQEDKLSYLIENGTRMIREKEFEKVLEMVRELPPEKKVDIRIRVIENFAYLKAYLVMEKKEYGKKWQVDYKPMVYTGDKRATVILLDLLNDEDPYVRAFTARALGYLGDHSALETIKRVVESDPNTKVRSRAREAYEKITGQKIPE
jgi:hypothetical protein